MKIRKNHFILLEIFIAISILALVIIPLSSFPFRAAQKQSEIMKEIECERIFSLSYAKLLSEIETFIDQDEIELGKYFVDLSSLGSYEYRAVAKLTKEVTEKNHFLVKTTLSLLPENERGFTPKIRNYFLYVEKK